MGMTPPRRGFGANFAGEFRAASIRPPVGFASGPHAYTRPRGVRNRPREGVVMHYDAHQPVIDGLEARIVTIRDSL